MSFAPLPAEAEVVRLVSHIDEHFPPDAEKPLPATFGLTPDDIAEGTSRNRPPLLSVFDIGKTTLPEARAIRAAMARRAGRVPKQMTGFGLKVSDVISIAVPGEQPRLRVIEDPLPAEWGSGAAGHAGIQGLQPRPSQANEKNKLKEIRRRLVDACFRLLG